MKHIIALLMVVGLCSFAFAQDIPAAGLDSPIAGTDTDATADTSGSSLFDQLMARMQSASDEVIGSRVWNWRSEFWWINAWEWQHNPDWSTGVFGGTVWAGDNRDTFDEWKGQLTAAEQLALSNEANAAHERILAAGLN